MRHNGLGLQALDSVLQVLYYGSKTCYVALQKVFNLLLKFLYQFPYEKSELLISIAGD